MRFLRAACFQAWKRSLGVLSRDMGAQRAAPLSLRGHSGPGAGVEEVCTCPKLCLIVRG